MFQFRRFPSYSYWFTVWCINLTLCGFLHSDICGSIRACRSPQLFAAYRVLLRLLMPRHPSCALISLTYLFRIMVSYRCFQQKNFFEIVFTHLFLDIYLLKKLFPLCCFVIQFSKNRSHHSAFEASWCHFPIFWWAEEDSNLRPLGYQPSALTSWAISPYRLSSTLLTPRFSVGGD